MNNPSPFSRYFVFGMLSLLLCSCADNPSQNSPTISDIGTSQTQNTIDSHVAKQTCEAIAAELSNNDEQSLNERIDTIPISAGISIALSHHPISLQERRVIEQNLGGHIRKSLIPKIENKQWEMRRGTTDGDYYLCLLRSTADSEDARYLEFELKEINNSLKITDLNYVERNFKVSESFSTAFNDYIELFSTMQNGSFEQQMTAKQEFALVTAFWNYLGSSNPRRLLTAYNNLPSRLKHKPAYIKITAASVRSLNKAGYMGFLQDIQTNLFFDLDRYGLLMLDYYLEYHQYENAKHLISKFMEYIGPDASLDMYLARLELAQGNTKSFYHYCEQAMEHEPAHLETYSILLDQLVIDRHYDDAVLVLRVLRNKFDKILREEHCESGTAYRNFCRSSEYQSWKQANG